MDSVTNFFWNDTYGRGSASTIDTVGSDSNDKDKNTNGTPTTNRHNRRFSNSLEKMNSRDSGSNVQGSFTNTAFSTSGGLQKAMTDTLVEKIIKMAIPASSELAANTIKNRMAAGKERPSLSVPITSRNFILMNSRLSVPFLVIDEIIKILNWVDPAYTLSMALIYTLIVLRPLQVLSSLPILYLLFGIMVPEYLHIHEPSENVYLDTNRVPAQGPPLRKAEVPRPVPEFSQEFVLNLTDLQNHMLLYVQLYDSIIYVLQKFAFFVNEQISAVAFVLLMILAVTNIIFIDVLVRIIPIKLILVATGWAFIIICHPKYRDNFFNKVNSEETRLRLLKLTSSYDDWVNDNLGYVEARETKVVIIYEMQKYKDKHKEWHPVGYANDDFTLFSQFRINENAIESVAVPSLDSISPPTGWEWAENSSWVLDLDPTGWVEEGFIQFVQIDPETKWVYDINLDGKRGKYRRRLWTNTCVRQIHAGVDERNASDKLREVSNPLRSDETHSRSIHGVSKGSMSGNVKTEADIEENAFTDEDDSHITDDSIASNILNTTI